MTQISNILSSKQSIKVSRLINFSEDKYASKSPFTKSCFRGIRNILTVDELKEKYIKDEVIKLQNKNKKKKGISHSLSMVMLIKSEKN